MAATTKLELEQINARLANELCQARARIALLEGDVLRANTTIEQLRHNLVDQAAVASAVNHMSGPAWQRERVLAMAIARDIATSSGRVVKV